MSSAITTEARRARTFRSTRELAMLTLGLGTRFPRLVAILLGGRVDAHTRELVMVAVSRSNACGICTRVHERLALQAGVSDADLETLGLGDLAALDPPARASVVYATALAEGRFVAALPIESRIAVARSLSETQRQDIEALARFIGFANYTVGTLKAFRGRLLPA